jgi:hypothetical protein
MLLGGVLVIVVGPSRGTEERAGQAAAPAVAATPAPPAPGKPRMLADEPVAITEGDSEMLKLLKTRYNTALHMLKAVGYQQSRGVRQASDLFKPAQRVTRAALELTDDPQRKVAALEKLLEIAEQVERTQGEMWRAGRLEETGALEARYDRLSVEIRLLRARQEASGQKKG